MPEEARIWHSLAGTNVAAPASEAERRGGMAQRSEAARCFSITTQQIAHHRQRSTRLRRHMRRATRRANSRRKDQLMKKKWRKKKKKASLRCLRYANSLWRTALYIKRSTGCAAALIE